MLNERSAGGDSAGPFAQKECPMPSSTDLPVVAVVGSLVMDLIFRVQARPRAGETVFGQSFQRCNGGKGFNQAIAARRTGAAVIFAGKVGDDEFGREFRTFLEAEGIETSGLFVDAGSSTGVACPIVDAAGENAIVVVPGANMAMTAADVELARPALERARVLLLQHEITAEASRRAAEIVHAAGGIVVLNPAPAAPLDADLVAIADYLVPNEAEAQAGAPDAGSPIEAARALQRRLGKTIVLTCGGDGAYVFDADGEWHVPAFPVKVVDTTGAGDAFCGGFAVALASGLALPDAIRFAAATGALAVTRAGTGPAMPVRSEVDQLLQ